MNRKKAYCFFLLFFLFLGKVNPAYSQKTFGNSIFNYGFKIGLNAISTNHYDVFQDNRKLKYGDYENRNGYLANGFFRVNFKHLFVQPEVEWNLYRQNAIIALPVSIEEGTYQSQETIKINSNAFNLYLLAGYNVVKNVSYLAGIYVGAGVKTQYKSSYDFGSNGNYKNTDLHDYYTGVVGVSINVGIIHFDARYQFHFFDTNLDFNTIENIPLKYQAIQLKKNENMLSFSCGVMF